MKEIMNKVLNIMGFDLEDEEEEEEEQEFIMEEKKEVEKPRGHVSMIQNAKKG